MAEQDSVRFSVPADHPCLAGHFPGQPIVPAVVLLEKAMAVLQPLFPHQTPGKILQAKFLHPLLPEQAATLQVEADHGTNRARFQFFCGQQTIARGEILFTGTLTRAP